MGTLYDTDYYAWTQEQAHLLRTLTPAGVDWEHLAEELDDRAWCEEQILENHLQFLLEHLLKLGYAEPHLVRDHQRYWRLTCLKHRLQIAQSVRKAPSLARVLEQPETVTHGYTIARLEVLQHLECVRAFLKEEMFPETCPWTLDDVLRRDFFPA